MGFRPITDEPKHTQMIKEFFGTPFAPVAKAIRDVIRPPQQLQTPLSPYARPNAPFGTAPQPSATSYPLPLAAKPEEPR